MHMYRLWYYFYLVIQVKGAAVIETEANLKFTRLLIVYKVCNNTRMKMKMGISSLVTITCYLHM